ncbi:hypothetical protein [Actinomadura sp. 6N118]|uniref:hypothetical protein n=1 Tax=Actinomadura sp. 6N118 TaxID=3375151 RepID=UPI0037A2DF32
MSSDDIPDDLLDLKVANLQAEVALSGLAARMPRAVDIVAGTAEADPKDIQGWDQAMATARDTAVKISLHAWMRDGGDKAKAHQALLAAAKERMQN